MSEQELNDDVRKSGKSIAKNRKKRPNKKVKRLGIAGSYSESQQKEKANSLPVLRHMNPPPTPQGISH
jgi:hypothetical protein